MSRTDGSDSLPSGWAQVKLAVLGALHCGQSPSVAEVNSKGIGTPYVTGPEQWDGQSIRMHKWTTSPKRLVPDGTIFITVKGAGVGTLFPGCACAIGRDIYAFEPSNGIDRDFLVHGLRYNINEIIRKAQGDIPGLTKGHILDHEISLPPMPEQRRIVAKLGALLTKVDASRKRLERIPVILKRFRQAVLVTACDGRLTEDWRSEHREIEPASKMLNRLRTPEPDPFLQTFEDSSTRDLPDTWSWVPLGKLGRTMGGGTPSKENEEFWSGSIPWVSPKDMKRDRIADSQDHISEKALDQSPVNQIPRGSILFVIRGMILNHTLPVAITDEVVTINQDMKALIPEIPEVAEYLFLASKYLAPAILFQVKEATHGTRRIETPLLKNWAVPFPPLQEQQEIVRRVSELFLFSDQIEARYAKAKAQVDRLTQSILAKAFRGELVPQDPNDEPADALLSRLATSPAEAPAPTRRQGRPPRLQPAAPPVAPAPPAQVNEASDREAPTLADLTPKAIRQAHREVLATIPSPLSADNLLRAVALRLGFQRLGSRIKARIQESLPS